MRHMGPSVFLVLIEFVPQLDMQTNSGRQSVFSVADIDELARIETRARLGLKKRQSGEAGNIEKEALQAAEHQPEGSVLQSRGREHQRKKVKKAIGGTKRGREAASLVLESLLSCGYKGCGMELDPTYLQYGFSQKVQLNGVRNADARNNIMEAAVDQGQTMLKTQ